MAELHFSSAAQHNNKMNLQKFFYHKFNARWATAFQLNVVNRRCESKKILFLLSIFLLMKVTLHTAGRREEWKRTERTDSEQLNCCKKIEKIGNNFHILLFPVFS